MLNIYTETRMFNVQDALVMLAVILKFVGWRGTFFIACPGLTDLRFMVDDATEQVGYIAKNYVISPLQE